MEGVNVDKMCWLSVHDLQFSLEYDASKYRNLIVSLRY